MLAAGFDLIYVVVAIAIIGKIKEWMDGQKKPDVPPPGERTPLQPQSIKPPSRPPESEQERMRRFMEALGMPAGNQVPTPVAVPVRPRTEARPARQPKVIRARVATPAPEPLPMEARDPGRLEEPATKIESISTEWGQMAKGITLSAMETPQAPGQSQASLPFAIHTASTAADILIAMRTPATLRTAVLLREILGPPPSMAEPKF